MSYPSVDQLQKVLTEQVFHYADDKKKAAGRALGTLVEIVTRLRFLVNGKDGGKGAPMSCAMIYWGNHYEKFRDVFGKHGAVVNLTEMLTPHLHAGSNDAQPELISEFHRDENGSEMVLAESAVEYGISKRLANHRGPQPRKRPLAKH
jgi:hypothetical protein